MSEKDDVFVPETGQGSIPVLAVTGRNLPEAWERSCIVLRNEGREIRTEYDRKDGEGNFIDPPSRDCTMITIVENPVAEPRIHKCFPGGPADLQEYRMEVVDGIKNHWVDLEDKAKWQYTYHERLRKYRQVIKANGHGEVVGTPIDQIQKVIEHLAESPITRRCQAITWQPWEDMDSSDPPCLQRMWFRIMIDAEGQWWLNMNVEFRSRDAYKAAFMNMDAFIHFMEYIALEVGKIAGREVKLGRYCDKSDSYHIYGKDLEQFDNEFVRMVKAREFYLPGDPMRSRAVDSADWKDMMEEAVPEILEKIRKKDEADAG